MRNTFKTEMRNSGPTMWHTVIRNCSYSRQHMSTQYCLHCWEDSSTEMVIFDHPSPHSPDIDLVIFTFSSSSRSSLYLNCSKTVNSSKQQCWTSWNHRWYRDFYDKGLQRFVHRYQKCFENNGDNIGKLNQCPQTYTNTFFSLAYLLLF